MKSETVKMNEPRACYQHDFAALTTPRYKEQGMAESHSTNAHAAQQVKITYPGRKKGRFCFPIFSDEDSDLRDFSWILSSDGYGTMRRVFILADGRKVVRDVHSHRVVLQRILNRDLSADEFADHINRDRLDNRRTNIRVTGSTGNAVNRGSYGVTYVERHKRWQGFFSYQKRSYFCGRHATREAAVMAVALKKKAVMNADHLPPYVDDILNGAAADAT